MMAKFSGFSQWRNHEAQNLAESVKKNANNLCADFEGLSKEEKFGADENGGGEQFTQM